MSIRSMTITARPTGPVIRVRVLRMLELLFLWDERHRARRSLAAMDDRLLSDIGIGRSTALTEAGKPFWRP